jgi:hypothetical protein
VNIYVIEGGQVYNAGNESYRPSAESVRYITYPKSAWIIPYIYNTKAEKLYKYAHFFPWKDGASYQYLNNKSMEKYKLAWKDTSGMKPYSTELDPIFNHYIKNLRLMKKTLIQAGASPQTRLGFTRYPENAENVKVFKQKMQTNRNAKVAKVACRRRFTRRR